MKEIIIDKNENEQRLDRFLNKYLAKAPKGFVQKMIRKKNVKINGKKASPEITIFQGDVIQLYLSDETINKFIIEKGPIKSKLLPKIIYEDDNIILINKEIGVLSHGAGDGDGFEENIVDSMISYLIEKGDYVPRIERTFTPSICNRLDRNTPGIVIGAKNYESLKALNEAIKNSHIRRFYKTIVKGVVKEDFLAEGYLTKNEDKNIVKISLGDVEGSKKIVTDIHVLSVKDDYSLLEIELITGRTHQIRGHLASLGYPVIGDRKYGNKSINKYFNDEFRLDNQWLHGYKIQFNGLDGELEYLNGQEFISQADKSLELIEETLFKN